MQELARESHKYREGSGQTTEFDNTKNRTFVQDSNLAESGSFAPVEDVSEDFSNMNRGQDVITESERIKRLEQRLNEAEEKRLLLRQESDELNITVKVLKEKTTPELLKELQEKFHDQPWANRC
jgi:hypothetical protein